MTSEVFSKLICSMILIWNMHMPLPRTPNTKLCFPSPCVPVSACPSPAQVAFPGWAVKGSALRARAATRASPTFWGIQAGNRECGLEAGESWGGESSAKSSAGGGDQELEGVGKHRGVILFWKPSYCIYRRCSQSHNTWVCFGVFSNIRSGREPN